MKKLLEVVMNGDNDIRFNTDFDARKEGKDISEITSKLTIAMATKLWGKNEEDVIAIIRALTIADMSLCTNRKQMLKMLDECSRDGALMIEELSRMNGVVTFTPNVKPSGQRS